MFAASCGPGTDAGGATSDASSGSSDGATTSTTTETASNSAPATITMSASATDDTGPSVTTVADSTGTDPSTTSTDGPVTTGQTDGGSSSGEPTTTDEGGSSSTGVADGCGDGNIDPGEQCDGMNLQGFDCGSLGLGGGVLACDPMNCTFDVSGCVQANGCGDGNIDPGEQCDGNNLQGFTCAALGLGGGMLSCDPVTCTFDTSMCNPGMGGTGGLQ